MPEAPPMEEAPDVSTPAEPLACEGCGKGFKNKAGLGAHRVVCKGKRPEQDKQGADAAKPRTTKERAPRVPSEGPKGRRHDASGILGSVWGGLARVVPSAATQRCMVWQAPSAGKVLDSALEGSFLDKQVLQRVAGAESKYKPLTSLLGLPVLIFLADRNPAMLPVLYGPIRVALEDNLEAALDAAAEAKRRQERLSKKALEAGIDLTTTDENGERVDLIDNLLSDLLGQSQSETQAA